MRLGECFFRQFWNQMTKTNQWTEGRRKIASEA